MNPDYGASTGTIAVISVIYAVIGIGGYVWSSIATAKVFAKLGEDSWKGWVPILNTITILRLGSMSPVWVVALFFPLVNIAGLVVFYYAIHNINTRFAKGAGFTILAVFAYPVWASVLGFGSATVGPTSAQTAAFQARMDGLQPGAVPPAPPAALATPAGPPPPPALAGPPAPPVPAGPPAPPAPAAWTPPPGIVTSVPSSVPASAPPPPPAPVIVPPAVITPPPPAPVPPAPAPVDDDPYEDFDKTVMTRRKGPAWSITPEGSAPIPLTSTVVVLGRKPVASVADPVAQLVPVADPSKTVSKTHARLELVDGAWFVTDLDSTNGVFIVAASGEEIEVTAGASVAVGERFLIGELAITVRAES